MDLQPLLADAANRFFQCYLPQHELDSRVDDDWKTEHDYLWGSITIQAESPVYIRVLIPGASAIALLNQAMGGNATHVNPMVLSAVAELLNTIGGSMKVPLIESLGQSMELGLPIVHDSESDAHPDALVAPVHFFTRDQSISFWCTAEILGTGN